MNDLFLTGANGFLGSRLLERLDLTAYSTITLLCRSEPVLPTRLAAAGNVRVVIAALEEVDRYVDQLGPETIIVHLAAVTSKADRAEYFSVNTHATSLLIRVAETAGVAGFLFASSIAVAFNKRRGYHYAESKQLAEQLLKDSALPYCILRPTIILGEDSPIWQSFSTLAKGSLIVLPGNGRISIQPIDADDLVQLITDIVSDRRFHNELLEIGGPDVLSMDEFVRRIHKAYTGKQPYIMHLPLGFILVPLRVLERIMPSLLPVSAGQLASFNNDGTVTANDLVQPLAGKLMGIDEMISRLVQQSKR